MAQKSYGTSCIAELKIFTVLYRALYTRPWTSNILRSSSLSYRTAGSEVSTDTLKINSRSTDMQDDSKLWLGFSWPVIFKLEIIK